MPFQLSPGVAVVEKDFSSIVPAVSSSTGAFAGQFVWGPVLEPVRVSSENELVARYGKPTDTTAQSFFTAANFLSYTNAVWVTRGDATGALNAVAATTGNVSAIAVSNAGSGYTSAPTVTIGAPNVDGGIQATGTATISGAGITGITLAAAGSGYTSAPTVTITAASGDNGYGGTATAVLSGAAVSTISVSNGGSGYASAPAVTISAPQKAGGTQATATATIDGSGVVTAIVITNAGTGYTSAPTVTIASPGVYGETTALATATIGGQTVTSVTVGNAGTAYKVAPTVTISGGGGTGATVGAVTIGTSTITGITLTNSGSGYSSAPTVTLTGGGGTGAAATASVVTGTGVKINNAQSYQNLYDNGEGLVGEFAARYPGALGNSLKISMADSGSFTGWTYADQFDSAPGTSTYADAIGGSNDELHVVVVDEDGLWTGTQGAVLEKFAYVSKASDAKKSDGTNNYYKEVINLSSKYVWWMDHTVLNGSGAAWGTTASGTFKTMSSAVTRSLSGGADGANLTDGQLQTAWALYVDADRYDISLLPLGKASSTVANFVINNVVEVRKDCVAFASAQNSDTGEIIIGEGSDAITQIVEFRTHLPSTSYAVLDTGFKYQYDRYNDKYRWVPLNGDTAGLCARTDYTNDPWWSPGGLNRGQVKNVIKLAVNPNKSDRDELYKNGVNPVVSFRGEGTVLFGDKTLLSKPSAFDRINVRRLFITLEKAVAIAAKYQLFEFNDSFTRAMFRSMVEPFLRDVQGRRGIIDFVVKCDDTNNTGEVIDRNEFVADIFIKPARSINFITLNFVAARTSANFSEIGG